MASKPNIVYKVVQRYTRQNSNWMIATHDSTLSVIIAKARDFRKQHPEYFPTYKKGALITAAPKSPGIMCFATLSDATKFSYYTNLKNTKIIRLRGIGRGKTDILVWSYNSRWLENLLEPELFITHPPLGTIAFKSVEVLE